MLTCVCLSKFMYTTRVKVSTVGASRSLQVEFQAFVVVLMWVLGTEHKALCKSSTCSEPLSHHSSLPCISKQTGICSTINCYRLLAVAVVRKQSIISTLWNVRTALWLSVWKTLVNILCGLKTNVYIYSLRDTIIRRYLLISFVQAVSILYCFLLSITSVNKRDMLKLLTLWIPLIIPVGLGAQCVCTFKKWIWSLYYRQLHLYRCRNQGPILVYITQLDSLSSGLFCVMQASYHILYTRPSLSLKSQDSEYRFKSNSTMSWLSIWFTYAWYNL